MPPSDDEPVTQVTCPARGCEQGHVYLRTETTTGYSVTDEGTCTYCRGTGIVTPARAAAWRRLMKHPIPH